MSGFTTCFIKHFIKIKHFNFKEVTAMLGGYSCFIMAANTPGALTAAWPLNHMSLVQSLSCSPRGLFHTFSSVLKAPFSSFILSAHSFASCITEEMETIRGELPQAPTITSPIRGSASRYSFPSCCVWAVCALVIFLIAHLLASPVFSLLGYSHQLSNRIIS